MGRKGYAVMKVVKPCMSYHHVDKVYGSCKRGKAVVSEVEVELVQG
jgi:hypothetical protein